MNAFNLFLILISFNSLEFALGSEIELLQQSMVTEKALTFTKGGATKFSNSINGRTHQQTPLTSYRGYQYITYFDSERRVCIGRRKLPSHPWEVIQFQDHKFQTNDSHNTAVLGICDRDGTIHMAFDHHATPLNYRVSKPGVAHAPERFPWRASLFGPVTHKLGSVTPADRVTYPRFFSAPNGNLMLYYRSVTSANGDGMIEEYNGETHDWTPGLGKFISRDKGQFRARGETSEFRCPYMNPLAFSGTRLHATWIWRDLFKKTDARNQHSLCHAYSDDYGRSWKNTDGKLIAKTGSEPIHLNTPGLVVVDIPVDSELSNQNGQFCSPDGTLHVAMLQRSESNSERSYHHYWRTAAGKWHHESLPFSGNRPKLVGDKDRNLYLVSSDNDRLQVITGTPRRKMKGWNWRLLPVPSAPSVFGDALLDMSRWKQEQILAIYSQDVPKARPIQGKQVLSGNPSPLRVTDYRISR